MNWNSIMGFISTTALFLPVVFILTFRLAGYRSFPALLFYYFLVFVYNLFTEGYLRVSPQVPHYWGLVNNVLDTPLMLLFLTYFSTSPAFTRRLRIIILFFLAFEIAIIGWKGLTIDAVTIIMAPGLATVLYFCFHFFIRQTRITIMHHKATGKAFIISALLFAYGCYALIYLFYYILKLPDTANTFLIYFFVTTFSSLLLCAGILIERKRVQKLSELKITRKELSSLYKESKPAPSFKKVVLDFDKEQWN